MLVDLWKLFEDLSWRSVRYQLRYFFITFDTATKKVVDNCKAAEGQFFIVLADKGIKAGVKNDQLIGWDKIISVGGESRKNAEEFESYFYFEKYLVQGS